MKYLNPSKWCTGHYPSDGDNISKGLEKPLIKYYSLQYTCTHWTCVSQQR